MRSHYAADGIVLRTYDVGEADRLCVVLTRERGRIAARARAVRKPGSRMGALLLPGRRLSIDVSEDGGHATVSAARLHGDVPDLSSLSSLAAAHQGIELVLLLTEDGEPLPAVFDALHQFLHAVAHDPVQALRPFQLRLFHLLGFLPEHGDDARFAALDAADRAFVRLCAKEADLGALCAAATGSGALDAFAEALREQHLRRELKSAAFSLVA